MHRTTQNARRDRMRLTKTSGHSQEALPIPAGEVKETVKLTLVRSAQVAQSGPLFRVGKIDRSSRRPKCCWSVLTAQKMVLIFQRVCRICPMNPNDTTVEMAGIPTVMTRLPALRELNLSEVQGRSHQRLPARYSCPSMRRATCACYRRSRAVNSTARISRMCAAPHCIQRRVAGD